jgi:hypothetical protein
MYHTDRLEVVNSFSQFGLKLEREIHGSTHAMDNKMTTRFRNHEWSGVSRLGLALYGLRHPSLGFKALHGVLVMDPYRGRVLADPG